MENDGVKLVVAIQNAAVECASELDVTPEDMITALCSVTVGMTMELSRNGREAQAMLSMMKIINNMVLRQLSGGKDDESSFVQRHH